MWARKVVGGWILQQFAMEVLPLLVLELQRASVSRRTWSLSECPMRVALSFKIRAVHTCLRNILGSCRVLATINRLGELCDHEVISKCPLNNSNALATLTKHHG